MKLFAVIFYLLALSTSFNLFAAQSYEINHGIFGEKKSVSFTRSGKDLYGETIFPEKVITVNLYEKIETISVAYRLEDVVVGKRCTSNQKVYSTGTGNKKLKQMFEAEISSQKRMHLIAKNIKGAGKAVSKTTFVVF